MRKESNKQSKIWKRKSNQYNKNTINHENICQQIGQHRKNEQISRDKHLPGMKQEETDNLHRPITNSEIKFAVKKNTPSKQKI